jgi:hypothetical protein
MKNGNFERMSFNERKEKGVERESEANKFG